MRGMNRVMENRIIGLYHAPGHTQRLSRIRIDIKSWKVAAGNIDPDSVALFKDVGGAKRLNNEFVYLSRVHKRLPLRGVPIPCPQDAVGQVHFKSGWEIFTGRVDID